MCHVTTLPHYHVIELPRYQFATLIVVAGLKCRRRATLIALADLKTYHVVKLLCGRRFATLFALCVPPPVSCHVVFAVEDFAVVGVSIDDRPPGLLTLLS